MTWLRYWVVLAAVHMVELVRNILNNSIIFMPCANIL